MGQGGATAGWEEQHEDGRTASELIAAYRQGPAALREAVAGMTAEQLHARPIPGMMSSLEVLAHVVDSDQFMADRMKRCVAMDRPLLIGADGFLYPESLGYHERDVDLDLDLLDVTRRQMAADLERLAEEAWTRDAVHSEIGLVTLRDLLLHTIRHLEGHVERIREKRVALGV